MFNRYDRHNLIDWFDQKKLQDAHIIIVGAGAVGNEVLKNLTLLGVGHLYVFDFDRIEEHNLTRSILFREADIGKYKAEVAVNVCHGIDSNVDIKSSITDFWDSLSFQELLKSDVVVCCADNFEARINLNKLCLITKKDLYNISIDSRYVTVEFFSFSSNSSPCYECTLPSAVYNKIQKRYSCGWLRKVAQNEKKIPTTTITSSLASAVAVSLILNRLTQHSQSIHYNAFRYFQDSITLENTLSIFQKNESCFTCSNSDPKFMIFKSKRTCSNTPILPLPCNLQGEIVLSEPVLIRGTCLLCGREQEYFESTRKLTDAVTYCLECQSYSIATQFVERLTLPEFERIFVGRKVSCKYLTYFTNDKKIIIELED